jgi:nitrate reductase gamma subunit
MDRSTLRGVMLIFVYWGFFILLIGTVIVALDYDFGLHILKGQFYLVYSLVLDIAGGFALISLLFSILRRYLFSRHEVVSSWDDTVVLVLLFLVMLSGFCVEGTRLARLGPPLADWSPAGALFASFFCGIALGQAALTIAHRVLWMFHAASALLFIAYIPFSKQFHMIAAQIITLEAARRKARLREVVHE